MSIFGSTMGLPFSCLTNNKDNSITNIISESDNSLYLNFTNNKTLFSDSAGTTNVIDGDKIALAKDYLNHTSLASNSTATNQPIYEVGVDGISYASLDGLNQYFDVSNLSSSSVDHTFIAVIETPDSDLTDGESWLMDIQSGRLVFSNKGGDPVSFGSYTDRVSGVYPGSWYHRGRGTIKSRYILSFTCYNNVTEIFKNGVSVGEIDYTPVSISGAIKLFSGQSGAIKFKGKCYSLIYIDRKLSYNDRRDVERELADHSGLSGFYTKNYESYVALGDSITHGYGDDSTTNIVYGRNIGLGYPIRLAPMISNSKDNIPISINDEGYNVATSQDILDKLDRVMARNMEASHYLFMIGHNDATSSQSFSDGYETRVRSILSKLTNAGKKVTLAYSPYYKGSTDYVNIRIRDYNAILETLKTEYPGITQEIPDLYTWFQDNQSNFLSGDTTHPNGQGYEDYANLMFNAMNWQNKEGVLLAPADDIPGMTVAGSRASEVIVDHNASYQGRSCVSITIPAGNVGGGQVSVNLLSPSGYEKYTKMRMGVQVAANAFPATGLLYRLYDVSPIITWDDNTTGGEWHSVDRMFYASGDIAYPTALLLYPAPGTLASDFTYYFRQAYLSAYV